MYLDELRCTLTAAFNIAILNTCKKERRENQKAKKEYYLAEIYLNSKKGGVYNIEAFNMLPLVKRRKKYALKMDLPEEDVSKSLKYPPEISGGVLASLPPLRAQIEIRKEIFLPENFEPRIAYFSVKQSLTFNLQIKVDLILQICEGITREMDRRRH